MNALLKIGKYLFALPLLGFVYGHFTSADAMAGMVPIPGRRYLGLFNRFSYACFYSKCIC